MDDLSFFDSALSDTEMDELLMSCKKEAEQKKRKEASATEHQKKKKQKKQKKVKDTEDTDAIPELAVPSTPPTSPAKESNSPTSEEKKEVTPSSFTPKCQAKGLPLHAVRRQVVQTKPRPKGLKANYPSKCGVGACRHLIMKEPEWNKKKGVWVARCAMTYSGNRSSYHTWYSVNEGKSWEFTTTLYNLFKTPAKEQKQDIPKPEIQKEGVTPESSAGQDWDAVLRKESSQRVYCMQCFHESGENEAMLKAVLEQAEGHAYVLNIRHNLVAPAVQSV